MNGWNDLCEEWMDGYMYEWMDELIDGRMNGVGELMNG